MKDWKTITFDVSSEGKSSVSWFRYTPLALYRSKFMFDSKTEEGYNKEMNTETKENLGYGYRLLKIGEKTVAGDEVWVKGPWGAKGTWQKLDWPGHCCCDLIRRRIDVGKGFRLVGENEVVKKGDQMNVMHALNTTPWYNCVLTVGCSPKDNHNATKPSDSSPDPFVYRRPLVEKPKSMVGYELVEKGAVLTAEDEQYVKSAGIWTEIYPHNIGVACPGGCFRRRAKVELPKTIIMDSISNVSDGYKYLEVGEVIQKGDEFGPYVNYGKTNQRDLWQEIPNLVGTKRQNYQLQCRRKEHPNVCYHTNGTLKYFNIDGYRLLKVGEIKAVGDEAYDETNKIWFPTVEPGRDVQSYSRAYRRKVAAKAEPKVEHKVEPKAEPKPELKKAEYQNRCFIDSDPSKDLRDPGDGYRWLMNGEVLETRDECLAFFDMGFYQTTYAGGKVGEVSSTCCAYRRKIEVIDNVRITKTCRYLPPDPKITALETRVKDLEEEVRKLKASKLVDQDPVGGDGWSNGPQPNKKVVKPRIHIVNGRPHRELRKDELVRRGDLKAKSSGYSPVMTKYAYAGDYNCLVLRELEPGNEFSR